MTGTFKFTNSIYLSNGVFELDLHNNYDFTGFSYSIETKSVILFWKRRNDNWVPSSSPAGVEVIYEEVESFQFQPRNPEMPFTEDDCLANFGYWTDEDWCDGVFTTEATPDPGWLKAFEFMSEAVILIKSNKEKINIIS